MGNKDLPELRLRLFVPVGFKFGGRVYRFVLSCQLCDGFGDWISGAARNRSSDPGATFFVRRQAAPSICGALPLVILGYFVGGLGLL